MICSFSGNPVRPWQQTLPSASRPLIPRTLCEEDSVYLKVSSVLISLCSLPGEKTFLVSRTTLLPQGPASLILLVDAGWELSALACSILDSLGFQRCWLTPTWSETGEIWLVPESQRRRNDMGMFRWMGFIPSMPPSSSTH